MLDRRLANSRIRKTPPALKLAAVVPIAGDRYRLTAYSTAGLSTAVILYFLILVVMRGKKMSCQGSVRICLDNGVVCSTCGNSERLERVKFKSKKGNGERANFAAA